MNVTSAQYQNAYYSDGTIDTSDESIQATIDGVSMTVPLDPANRHYAAILEWVADGNTIQDAD